MSKILSLEERYQKAVKASDKVKASKKVKTVESDIVTIDNEIESDTFVIMNEQVVSIDFEAVERALTPDEQDFIDSNR